MAGATPTNGAAQVPTACSQGIRGVTARPRVRAGLTHAPEIAPQVKTLAINATPRATATPTMPMSEDAAAAHRAAVCFRHPDRLPASSVPYAPSIATLPGQGGQAQGCQHTAEGKARARIPSGASFSQQRTRQAGERRLSIATPSPGHRRCRDSTSGGPSPACLDTTPG